MVRNVRNIFIETIHIISIKNYKYCHVNSLNCSVEMHFLRKNYRGVN